jgi:hypothetical protein
VNKEYNVIKDINSIIKKLLKKVKINLVYWRGPNEPRNNNNICKCISYVYVNSNNRPKDLAWDIIG